LARSTHDEANHVTKVHSKNLRRPIISYLSVKKKSTKKLFVG